MSIKESEIAIVRMMKKNKLPCIRETNFCVLSFLKHNEATHIFCGIYLFIFFFSKFYEGGHPNELNIYRIRYEMNTYHMVVKSVVFVVPFVR